MLLNNPLRINELNARYVDYYIGNWGGIVLDSFSGVTSHFNEEGYAVDFSVAPIVGSEGVVIGNINSCFSLVYNEKDDSFRYVCRNVPFIAYLTENATYIPSLDCFPEGFSDFIVRSGLESKFGRDVVERMIELSAEFIPENTFSPRWIQLGE